MKILVTGGAGFIGSHAVDAFVEAGREIYLLFSQLRHIIGYSHEPRLGAAKPGETFKIFLDSQRARSEPGWSPLVSLEKV
jgi:nucleoside-diphosphate-sugar epimerase